MSKTRTPHVYSYVKGGETLYYVTFYARRWDGKNQKVKKMGFVRQSDAAAYEREYRDRLAGSPDMSFDALCDQYLDDLAGRVRRSTYVGRYSVINNHIRPAFASVSLSELTPAKVRAWQN